MVIPVCSLAYRRRRCDVKTLKCEVLSQAGRETTKGRSSAVFQWGKESAPSKIIRCPYCVGRAEFKAMVRQMEGDWFLCPGCGHLVLPSVWFFRCNCKKCVEYESLMNVGRRPSFLARSCSRFKEIVTRSFNSVAR